MAFCDLSKPGPWTSRLYEILRPSPHPLAVQFTNSQSRFRHKAGKIWRHALTTSVYHDLAGENNLLYKAARSVWRRFVRVECFGLSGLLFYEIRLPALSDVRNAGGNTKYHVKASGEYELSLNTVFGDPTDPSDEGMDVDDLLDTVHAKVVYFPAYACTSFIIGQVMTAFFRDQPSFRPHPSREGFSVPLHETLCEVNTPLESVRDLGDTTLAGAVDTELDGIIPISYSWQVICDDLRVFDELGPDLDDPHRPLCIRSSSLPPGVISYCRAFSVEDDDKEDGNTTASTIESIGPSTPPRSNLVEPRRSLQANFAVVRPSSSLDGLDCSIGLAVSNSKIARKPSECAPTFVASGTLCLSVYDELASFLDISY